MKTLFTEKNILCIILVLLFFRAGTLALENSADFEVYWRSARLFISGNDPYLMAPEFKGFVFKYHPLTLPLILPFGLLPWMIAKALWFIGSFLCLLILIKHLLSRGISCRALNICILFFWWILLGHFSMGQISLWIGAALCRLCKPPKGKSASSVIVHYLALVLVSSKLMTLAMLIQKPLLELWRLHRKNILLIVFIHLLIIKLLTMIFSSSLSLEVLFKSWWSAAQSGASELGLQTVRGVSNHSLNALVLRLIEFINGSITQFGSWPETSLFILLIIVGILGGRRFKSFQSPSSRQASLTNFWIWTSWCTLALPLAWHHTFVLVLPLAASRLEGALKSRSRSQFLFTVISMTCIGLVIPQTLGNGEVLTVLESFGIKALGTLGLIFLELVPSNLFTPRRVKSILGFVFCFGTLLGTLATPLSLSAEPGDPVKWGVMPEFNYTGDYGLSWGGYVQRFNYDSPSKKPFKDLWTIYASSATKGASDFGLEYEWIEFNSADQVHWRASLEANYLYNPYERTYGLGENASRNLNLESQEFNFYLRKTANVAGVFRAPLLPSIAALGDLLQIKLSLSPLWEQLREKSTTSQYHQDFGAFTQNEFRLRNRVGLIWDNRNSEFSPDSGSLAAATLTTSLSDKPINWHRVDLSLATHFSLISDRWLSLAFGSHWAESGNGTNSIPFTEKPRIGGWSTARGLPPSRFIVHSSATLRSEIRSVFIREKLFGMPLKVGAAPFLDLSRGSDRFFSLFSAQTHTGYGLSFIGSYFTDDFLGTLDLAWSAEGSSYYLTLGHAF